MQEKSHRKIIICDVSACNTHPDFRPRFRRKKWALYAEDYGTLMLLAHYLRGPLPLAELCCMGSASLRDSMSTR